MYICFYSEGRCAKKTMNKVISRQVNTHRMKCFSDGRVSERMKTAFANFPQRPHPGQTGISQDQHIFLFVQNSPSASWRNGKWPGLQPGFFLSQGSTHPFSRFTHPFPRFKPSHGYQFLVFGGRRIQPLSTLPSNTRHPPQPIHA